MTCKLCDPLECGEWHDAAQRVHATLVSRYWADDLKSARTAAKALWKAHRNKPDHRVTPKPSKTAPTEEQKERHRQKDRERRAKAREKAKALLPSARAVPGYPE